MKVEVLRWLQHPYAAKWDDIDELSILWVFSHAIDKRMRRAGSKGRREERYKGENHFWSSQLNFNLEVQTNTKFRAEAFEILGSSGLTLTKYRE